MTCTLMSENCAVFMESFNESRHSDEMVIVSAQAVDIEN